MVLPPPWPLPLSHYSPQVKPDTIVSILIEKYGAAPEITQAGDALEDEDDEDDGGGTAAQRKWKQEKKKRNIKGKERKRKYV